MISRAIFRVIVIGFFGMTWAFVVLPGLEAVGVQFSQFDKIISYIIAPLTGLITSQVLLKKVRNG